MTEPCVSVIIPAFNSERHITAAVESVLDQTGVSFEVIVINDGSKDNTHDLLQPYANRIHYVHQSNQGVSKTRNRGLGMAKGRFIVFLDSDDLLLPGKLYEQSTLLNRDPSLGVISSGRLIIDSNGNPIGRDEPWHDAPKLDIKTFVLQKPAFLGTMMIRRVWLERVGGFDPTLKQAEDVDLMLKMALAGCRFEWLRKITLAYRRHGQNTMLNGIEQAESLSRVMVSFFSRPGLPLSIRGIEKMSLFYTYLWIVWHLYITGNTQAIGEYMALAESCIRGKQNLLTVLVCFRQFIRHCNADDMPETHVQAMIPHLKMAMHVRMDVWKKLEAILRWRNGIWRHYVLHHFNEGRKELKQHSETESAARICLLASSSLFLSNPKGLLETVRTLDDDLSHVSGSRQSPDNKAVLPLMFAGLSLHSRQFGPAIRTIRHLIRTRTFRQIAGAFLNLTGSTAHYFYKIY